jgi:hypothetical protein
MITIGFQRARSIAAIWASDIPCCAGCSDMIPGLGSGNGNATAASAIGLYLWFKKGFPSRE